MRWLARFPARLLKYLSHMNLTTTVFALLSLLIVATARANTPGTLPGIAVPTPVFEEKTSFPARPVPTPSAITSQDAPTKVPPTSKTTRAPEADGSTKSTLPQGSGL